MEQRKKPLMGFFVLVGLYLQMERENRDSPFFAQAEACFFNGLDDWLIF